MSTVVASIHVHGPAEAIWALMCDPHCYPELADPTDRMLAVPDMLDAFHPLVGGWFRDRFGAPTAPQ